MIPTPRTDDQIGYGDNTMTMVSIEFARTLERELHIANLELSSLNAIIQAHQERLDKIIQSL